MSNLPPGVSASQIPGNTPEDEVWEKFIEQMCLDCDTHCLSAEEAHNVWRLGIAAFQEKVNHGSK